MKALFTTSIGDPEKGTLGTVELMDIEKPSVGPENVLVKVEYAAICGSDSHILRGNIGPLREVIQSLLPMPMGHEMSGVVVEVGSAVTNGLKPGDRVTGNYFKPCGACHFCRTGRENFCTSPVNTMNAMGEYVSWHMSQLHKLPDDVDLLDASLTEPLSIAFSAVEQAKIKLGSNVLIGGAGGIGLLAIELARLAGAGLVVVMEPVEEKRSIAIECGADYAFDPKDDNAVSSAMALVNDLGYDCLIEASGAPSSAQMLLNMMIQDGDAVYFSMYPADFNMNVNPFSQFYLRQTHLHGMYTSADIFPRVVNVLRRMNFKPIIQKVYPLSDYKTAMEDAMSGKYAKLVFKCNE